MPDEARELPQPQLRPVEEAGGGEELAGQYREAEEDCGEARTRQGRQEQATERQDGSKYDQEDPLEDVNSRQLRLSLSIMPESSHDSHFLTRAGVLGSCVRGMRYTLTPVSIRVER